MEQQTGAENAQTQTEQTSSAQSKAGNLESDLWTELNRLGNSFVEVVKVAWNSDQRRQLEQDIRTGLNSLAVNLEAGFKKVSETHQAKEFVNRAEDVASNVGEKVRNSDVARDLGEGLVQGLRALGEQLDKFAEELKTKDTASAPKQAEQSQDIPIDKV